MADEVRALDIGFVPNAGAPSPIFWSSDHTTALLFYGQSTQGPSERQRVLIEAAGCIVATLGYPNDEALPGHRLYGAGLRHNGTYEVLDSTWKQQIIDQNTTAFPRTPPHFFELRHFVVTFQDLTFECLADDIRARRVTGTTGAILRPYVEGWDA